MSVFKANTVVIIVFLLGCNKKSQLKSIRQYNWYTYSYKTSDSLTIEDITYQEWFFGKTTLYRFDSFGAFLSPITYKTKNDSLFSFLNKNDFKPKKSEHSLEFIGKIKMLNANSFYLINDTDTLKFYKITSNNTMRQYIIDKTSEKIIFRDTIGKYHKASNTRKELLYEKILSSK